MGLPVLRYFGRGWAVSLEEVISQEFCELLSFRRKIARIADRNFSGTLEIFGRGWNGEKMAWYHKLKKPLPYSSWVTSGDGFIKTQKLSSYKFCIATENIYNSVGYISEKLFDCLRSSTVPIYLGESSIGHYVPKSCFVDIRDFSSVDELLKYCVAMPENKWYEYIEAGKYFLNSQGYKSFSPQAFSETVYEAIKFVISSS